MLASVGCSSGAGEGTDIGNVPWPERLPVPGEETTVEDTPVPSDPIDPVFDEEFALAWAKAVDVQVAAGADAFLVIWSERSVAIRGRFFSIVERAPIGSSFIVSDLSANSHSQPRLSVAAGPGDEFLVVWSSNYAVRAAKVGLHGGVSASTQLATTGWKSPHVGWTGDAWLVTWSSSIAVGDTGYAIVRGIRLNSDGAPLDAEPFRLCKSSGADEASVVRAEDGVVLWCAQEKSIGTPGPLDGTVQATRRHQSPFRGGCSSPLLPTAARCW